MASDIHLIWLDGAAYRELTPPYLPGGEEEKLGQDILDQAARFW